MLETVFGQIFKSCRFVTQQEFQKLTLILPKKLDFKEIKFLVKVRDICTISKNNSIGIGVFG